MDEKTAANAVTKLIRDKIGKGYVERERVGESAATKRSRVVASFSSADIEDFAFTVEQRTRWHM